MRKDRHFATAFAMALGFAFAMMWVAGCFSERQSATGPLPQNGTCTIPVSSPAVGTVIVFIKNFAFVPQRVSIKRGTTVTWVNCDAPGTDSHTTTSNTGVWSSPALAAGDTYSRTFNDVSGAVFDYHCVPHPFMEGTVNVQ